MVAWLVPVALFWALSALYLGGAAIRFEGADGPRQLIGLLLHFVAYLVIYGVLRAVLGGMLGPVFGGIVFPIIIASVLLPAAGKLAFRLVGVSIVSDAHAAHG